MPLGNRDIGINLWVEENGDLQFYISKTDSYSEYQQLLKLGRVRVRFAHRPFKAGTPFRQILDIQKGTITIEAGEPGEKSRIVIWVDANHPRNRLEAQSDIPVEATIHLGLWRTGIREVTKPAEAHSFMGQNLEFEKIFEYPDSITSTPDQSLLWYHRNESSVVAETFKRQDMGHLAGEVTDPLIGLTSGCKLRGQNLVKNPSLA